MAGASANATLIEQNRKVREERVDSPAKRLQVSLLDARPASRITLGPEAVREPLSTLEAR